MFIKVKNAEYLDGCRLRLSEVMVVNLERHLKGPMFKSLVNFDYFKRLSIPFNTIQWKNGANFASEFLYEIDIPE